MLFSVVLSLVTGNDLIVDEIENHFHKTLVENLISLYKDKTINKKNATLIFSTHYQFPICVTIIIYPRFWCENKKRRCCNDGYHIGNLCK